MPLSLAFSRNKLEINRFKKKERERERQRENRVELAALLSPTKALCSPGSTT